MLIRLSLGAGLDRITGGFQTIVGNAGLGRDGLPLFISAALIFIGFFVLYSEESESEESEEEVGNRRVLAWFFSQFFVLASLIVALQGLCPLVPFRTDQSLTFGSQALPVLSHSRYTS